jgi:hypothetical protein
VVVLDEDVLVVYAVEVVVAVVDVVVVEDDMFPKEVQ